MGGIGSPNGSSGRDGHDSHGGMSGSPGSGGLITVTSDPQAKTLPGSHSPVQSEWPQHRPERRRRWRRCGEADHSFDLFLACSA